MTIGNLLVALLAFIVINAPGMSVPTSHTPALMFDSYVHLRATERPRPADPDAPRVKAFYHDKSKTIVLDRDFDPADVVDQGFLLHELVHWIQGMSGKNINNTCRGKLERPAYVLQRQYLQSRGKGELAPEPLWIVMLAQDCSNLKEAGHGF